MKLFSKSFTKKFHPAKKVSNLCADMPGPTTAPTDRERAAIFALAAGYITDWKTAFIAADEKETKIVSNYSALHSNVSHWKNCAKVKRLYDDATRFLAIRDQQNRDDASQEERRRIEAQSQDGGREEDSKHTQTKRPAAIVDYYDPVNQRTQINRIIAESDNDPKTQLDAIKAIQQTQRDDKQAARDQKQVRSYLPLRCESCPLYAKAAAKATK